MIRIQVRPNEPLESALRRFKRQCNYAGIFRLAKKYNFYEKKSDRDRRERRERIRTMQRAQRRAMGPTRVRRTARKAKFKRRGGHDNTDVENATAAALEEKGKELRLGTGAPAGTTPVTPPAATPPAGDGAASAADIAAAMSAKVEPAKVDPAKAEPSAAEATTTSNEVD